MQLHKEARRMLFHLDRQGFRIHVRFGLFDCNSAGEDVLLNVKSQSTKHESGSTKHESGSTKHESGSTSPESQSTNPESFANNAAVSSASAEVSSAPPPSDIFRLSFLRQQTSPYLCLADFLRPRNPEGQHDRIGIFCTAADESIEHLYEEGTADADTYRPWLDEHPVYFFGNGAAKCMETIGHPNAHLREGIVPLAKHMFPLAEKRIALGQHEDVAYFTPFYLKDFVAKTPKKLL